jgi:hypothetical protein
MFQTSELKRPPQAPERFATYTAQRLNAKAAAVCEAILFNGNPSFGYASEMAAQAVRTPGGSRLPPENWRDIFIAGVESRVDQTLCAGLPFEALAFEREERALLGRISSCVSAAPSPQQINQAWQTLKKLAPETFVCFDDSVDVRLFVKFFDQSKIIYDTRKDLDISSEWDCRSVRWWIRNLLKQPMPVDLYGQDEVQKQTAKDSWAECLVRPSLRDAYMKLELPTKRLNEDLKKVLLIADAIKYEKYSRTQQHWYRGYTFEELRFGIAHPLASSRERNYIHARREWILCSLSADPIRNLGSDSDLQWQLLKSQRSLLSAAWKYVGHSARTMGFDPRRANAAGGWRLYLLELLHRDLDGAISKVDPSWKRIADNMEKPPKRSRLKDQNSNVDHREFGPKWGSERKQ